MNLFGSELCVGSMCVPKGAVIQGSYENCAILIALADTLSAYQALLRGVGNRKTHVVRVVLDRAQNVHRHSLHAKRSHISNTKASPSTHTFIINYSQLQHELKLGSEKPDTMKIDLSLPGQPLPHMWGHGDLQNFLFLGHILSFSWFRLQTL